MEYKHFSHHHTLNIHKVEYSEGPPIVCSGCQSPCRQSTSVYACWQCNFFLHDHCGNATRYVNHPFHPLHPLILLPSPTYCSGSFLCNACGGPGNAFSYTCAPCEVDLHIGCAFLPPKITHEKHHHELVISHGGTDGKVCKDVLCGICDKGIGVKYWKYTCGKCDFDAHTYCGTTVVKIGLYQMDEPPSDDVTMAPVATESGRTEVELTEEAFVELYNLQVQLHLANIMAGLNVNNK